MKCHYCQQDFPLTQLQFVDDGMVPGIQMKRRRATCSGCRNRPLAIDGKPSEPLIEREPGSDDGPVTEQEPALMAEKL